MEDKELIELAAKAAGIKLQWHHSGSMSFGGWPRVKFDPLNDDGDALRLAARLNFRVDISYGTVRIVDELDNEHYLSGIVTDCGGQMAIVRLAIVRAAAQIGKEME